jgi:hypothetical protein
MCGIRNAYRIFVSRYFIQRPLGRPRRDWEDNIKMALKDIGYEGGKWLSGGNC